MINNHVSTIILMPYRYRSGTTAFTEQGAATTLMTPLFGRSGEIRTPDSWFRRPELFH
jgi:hypothetical protein